jgi:hypothetical protein
VQEPHARNSRSSPDMTRGVMDDFVSSLNARGLSPDHVPKARNFLKDFFTDAESILLRLRDVPEDRAGTNSVDPFLDTLLNYREPSADHMPKARGLFSSLIANMMGMLSGFGLRDVPEGLEARDTVNHLLDSLLKARELSSATLQ